MSHQKWPVILDANDFTGISMGIENLNIRTRKKERFCLENADGICHKGPPYELEYYRNQGYNIICPELIWLDYCDEDLIVDNGISKLSDDTGESHLVYTGTISSGQKHGYCNLLPLGRQLAEKKIHLHIYYAYYQKDKFSDYIELSINNKYFHFHDTIPFKGLNKEISIYDWHCHILRNITGPRFTEEKKLVSMGNKLFTSLESGLPMIVSDHLDWVKKFVEKYEVGLIIKDSDIQNIDKILLKADYHKLKDNVLKARRKLTLRKKAIDLEKFYQRVIS